MVSESVFCHLERRGGQSLVDILRLKGSDSPRGFKYRHSKRPCGLEEVRPVSGVGWRAPATVQAAWQLKLTGLPAVDFLFITVRGWGGGH